VPIDREEQGHELVARDGPSKSGLRVAGDVLEPVLISGATRYRPSITMEVSKRLFKTLWGAGLSRFVGNSATRRAVKSWVGWSVVALDVPIEAVRVKLSESRKGVSAVGAMLAAERSESVVGSIRGVACACDGICRQPLRQRRTAEVTSCSTRGIDESGNSGRETHVAPQSCEVHSMRGYARD
jgi:hypothetical protein